MKKFAFSLEKVFRFRSQQLEIEMNTLALMRFELAELENQIARLEYELEAKHNEFQTQSRQGISAQEVRKYTYYKANLEEQIKELKRQREEQLKKIEKQLGVVLERKKEVSGLEKLKEKQWEEYLEDERKAENEFILELVSAKTVTSGTD